MVWRLAGAGGVALILAALLFPVFVPARQRSRSSACLSNQKQIALALVPFYCFLRFWREAGIWLGAVLVLCVTLYFTWYRKLPPREEGRSDPPGGNLDT